MGCGASHPSATAVDPPAATDGPPPRKFPTAESEKMPDEGSRSIAGPAVQNGSTRELRVTAMQPPAAPAPAPASAVLTLPPAAPAVGASSRNDDRKPDASSRPGTQEGEILQLPPAAIPATIAVRPHVNGPSKPPSRERNSDTSVRLGDPDEEDGPPGTSSFTQQEVLKLSGGAAAAAPPPGPLILAPPHDAKGLPPIHHHPGQIAVMSAPEAAATAAAAGSAPGTAQSQQSQRSGPSQTSAQQSTAAATPSGSAQEDPNDPWAALQSQYGIKDYDPPATAHPKGLPKGDSAKEMLVLGADDDEFDRQLLAPHSMLYGNHGKARPPLHADVMAAPLTQPKQGGWGNGNMAQAGELMLGDDDWLDTLDPPGVAPTYSAPLQHTPSSRKIDQVYNRPPAAAAAPAGAPPAAHPPAGTQLAMPLPVVRGKPADDMVFEDIEDLDALLEDEMQHHGLSDKALASKLAAFEAQFNNERD